MPDDAAFVWDSTRPHRAAHQAPPPAVPAGVHWVTLREAADAVGIAPTTIRRWASRGRIPTRLADTDEGVRRMVGLAEVRERVAARSAPPPAPDTPAPQPTAGPQPAPAPVAPPDDHLLVPRDAWDKMLSQLGNLHEAGQQLAEARERAAKAETEVTFLRERLAELREQAAPEPPAAEPEPAPPPEPRWRALLRRAVPPQLRGERRE